jgi:hypothetical protein
MEAMTTAMAMNVDSAMCPREMTAATAVATLSLRASRISPDQSTRARVVCAVFMPV